MDHNEKSQAVDNIDEAEILEIIDHHRLGFLETVSPVMFRNQPVGCTGTIMYQIYQERNLDIPQNIAGLLCAAIISDTLMFRSPTLHAGGPGGGGGSGKDRRHRYPGIRHEMFHAGSNLRDKSAEEIFYQDFKKVYYGGMLTFGVGQINSMDAEELTAIRQHLLPHLKSECGKHGIQMVFFMLTNIIDEVHRTALLRRSGKRTDPGGIPRWRQTIRAACYRG